jgi:hypothetical protein
MEWNNRNTDIHHGIYSDIFSYDNLSDDKMEGEAFWVNARSCTSCIYMVQFLTENHHLQKVAGMVMASVRRMLHYLLMPILVSYLVKLNELYQSHN